MSVEGRERFSGGGPCNVPDLALDRRRPIAETARRRHESA
jgi:hypothetical protein